jgi:hypothetical protein
MIPGFLSVMGCKLEWGGLLVGLLGFRKWLAMILKLMVLNLSSCS